MMIPIPYRPAPPEPSEPSAAPPSQSGPTGFGFEAIMRRPRHGQFRAWYDRNSRLLRGL